MNLRLLVGNLAVVAISLTLTAARAADEAEIDGMWVMVSYENFGKVNEIPKAEQSTHTFTRGKLTIKVPVTKRDKEGTYTVDTSKNPKHLDMTYQIGDKVQTLPCICELDGDTLRVAMPLDGAGGGRRQWIQTSKPRS